MVFASPPRYMAKAPMELISAYGKVRTNPFGRRPASPPWLQIEVERQMLNRLGQVPVQMSANSH
jgi:hypothetical protein